jgi:spore coat protein U-like protein
MTTRTALMLHALLLLALMLLWPVQAQAQNCSTSAQTLAFGTTGTPTAQRDTTADVTVNCSGSAGTTYRVCLAINAGTAPSTVLNRVMRSGSNSLAYDIATTSGGATWGDNISAAGNEVSVTVGASGSGSATARMYGRISSGQNLPAGTYTSNLQVQGRIPSGGSPCINGTGSSLTATSFTATATLGGTCTITASAINFGTVANLTAGLSASGGLTITCSNTMPYSIALNAGTTTGNTIAARKMSLSGAGPGVVSYQLYQDASGSVLWGDGTTGAAYPGTGSGTAQSVPVHAKVPSQSTPSSGTYKDTVTATITY